MGDGRTRVIRWFAVMVAVFVSAACSVSSIDSEIKALIEACKEITDEALRVECLTRVAESTDD